MPPRSGLKTAFTLLELPIVVAIIGILASLLFPAIAKSKNNARSILCLSQLRQLGIQSIADAGDSGRLSIRPRANLARSPLANDPQLRKLYLCPADTERAASQNATNLAITNTSYFASYSATLNQPRGIVAGDRNVTVYHAAARAQVRQTGAVHLYRTNTFDWWRDIHKFKGNLLLADGSAHHTTGQKFTALAAEQPATFTWHIPNGLSLTTPAP